MKLNSATHTGVVAACATLLSLLPLGAFADTSSRPPTALTPAPIESGQRVRMLSVKQRDALAQFAKSSGAHTVLVIAGDTTEAINYGDAIANSLEAGAWTVSGRRADGVRAVTHRLGASLPSEPVIAVTPSTGIGTKLRTEFESIGIHVSDWTPSLGHEDGQLRVWIGALPK